MGGFRKISLPFVVLSIPPKGKGNSALLAATKKRPTMEKGIFVSDINEFTPVIEGIFVTCDVAKLNDKNGNPYWSLGLSDSTGTVQAKIWSQRGVLQPRELQSRSFVHVRGQANKFRDNLQVRIDALTVLAQAECEGLRLEDYFPPSPYDGEKGMAELMDLVMKEVAGTPWERLVQVFFGDEENRRGLSRIIPADPENKIHKLMEYAGEDRDVADPWYTGNFDVTYKDIDKGCRGFLEYLRREGRI